MLRFEGLCRMGAEDARTTGARLGTKVKVSRWKSHPNYRWRVSYIEGGKYRQKGFKTEKLAVEWAKKRGQESVEFGSSTNLTVAERSAVIDSREKLERIGLSLPEAIDFAVRYHERSATSTSVKNLIAEVLQTRANVGLSDSHLDGLTKRLGRFEKMFGNESVAHIEKSQVEKWLHGLAKDFHPRTVNHHRTALVLALNEAIEWGYIDKNPALRVKPMKVVEADTEVLTVAQAIDLLEKADQAIRPAFAIGLFAGIRDAEIKKLDWSDIDFETCTIHVRGINAKSAKNRHVEMSDNLRKWIQPLAKKSGPVWPRNGRALHDQAKLKSGFSNPETLSKKQKEERDDWQRWPNNGLRHSYASYHLAFHQDAARLALNMGHQDASQIFAHYRALVTQKAAVSYWGILPAPASS